MIDLQETTQPNIETRPKEPSYQEPTVEQRRIVEVEIQTLNSTNPTLQGTVKEILDIKKSTANMVEEYVMEVQTYTDEKAKIVLDRNPQNNQTRIVDLVRYVEPKEPQEPITMVENINPNTLVTDMVYPNQDTFVLDELHTEIIEFLGDKIKDRRIESVVKEHYGSNDEYNILLKSDDKSPQQI